MRSRSLLKRAVPAALAAGVALAGAPAAALPVNAVLLDDDQAPGFASGTLFDTVNSGAAVNDLGQVAFFGRATPATPSGAVFFGTDRLGPVQPGLIARDGDLIVGGGGTTLGTLSSTLAVDNSGRVVIQTLLGGAGTGTNGALVEDDLSGGPTSILHRQGDPIAPGSTTTLDDFEGTAGTAPSINNAGAVAFGASLSVPDPTPSNPNRRDSGRGYIVNDGTSVTVIDGSDPFGSFFSATGNIDIADNGNVAYRVDQLDQPRPQIVAQIGGTASVAAKAGDVVTIGGTLYTLTDVRNPKINSAGDVLYEAIVQGPDVDTSNDTIIMLNGQVILREGDALPNGRVWDDVLRDYALANDGTIVFAVEDGLGNISTSPWGLYYKPAGGTISSIFATGDSIEVAPGDVRTISQLRFLDSGLSHSGEWVAFTAELLKDGTGSAGVFRVNLQPIPLPAAGWALLGGLGALAALRRRA